MDRRAIILFGTLALFASACSNPPPTGAEVRPFAEIQASEIEFEPDPTFPGRGILHVTTTEPAICAIVWGKTESLGRFNNSLAMNGTGIVQHDVVLPEAQGGVTYFYRLQGSTADGSLYQSELMTFTLPESEVGPSSDPADRARGSNLALNATIAAVSSEFSDAWGGANAIDGDLATEWSSVGDGDESFITVDLGTVQQVAGFEFLTRSMADGSAITATYTVSIDDGEALGPFDAGSPATPAFVEVEVTGQVFRFDVTDSTGGNTGAIEIGIYGG